MITSLYNFFFSNKGWDHSVLKLVATSNRLGRFYITGLLALTRMASASKSALALLLW